MSAAYFDSCYLCKLHWDEDGSHEVEECAAQFDTLFSAMHGRAEFYSTGHRKLREGVATREELQAAFAQFQSDLNAGGLTLLSLTDAIIDRVEAVYASAPATTFLRAQDAIHLATAAEHGFAEAYSNDRHFLTAAALFGLFGVNVIR